ncbi:nucleoside diphosphate-linked moiety X motif 22 [Labeo rohita]|uniref:Nucleoside diphosphate-linked moiety X motif 22 n=1 Tax=Labeo rohita TaxID=84645 RepID=A0A498LT93_LABRO|nr:nucleoside diphosphate-linked moiety X motif 22 [Labeo rohita]
MSEAVDVAHRLGRPVAGRTRAIIILFVLRWVRDVIWKNAENSDYLKECKLRFGEDLTNEEKASRALLWPYVQKAHNEGKKAYFIGSKAYIDGREIVPEKMDTT